MGTSAGGALTLEMVVKAKQDGLPMPGAIAPGTPMADVTKTGDSFYTNEFVDNVLVSPSGFCDDAAAFYAHGHDMKDPLLSPVYADMTGFPPAILTTGTRDQLLSNTVRVHRKLRRAGVEADLNVYEGESHAQYQFDDRVPETKEAFGEIAAFFGNISASSNFRGYPGLWRNSPSRGPRPPRGSGFNVKSSASLQRVFPCSLLRQPRLSVARPPPARQDRRGSGSGFRPSNSLAL